MAKAKKSFQVKVFMLVIQLLTIAALLPVLYMSIGNMIWRYSTQPINFVFFSPILLTGVITYFIVRTFQSSSNIPVIVINHSINIVLVTTYMCLCLGIIGLVSLQVVEMILHEKSY